MVPSRRDAEGNETVRCIQEAGGEAIFVKTDVSKAAEVEALIDQTVHKYGRLDCAFNNADRSIVSPLVDIKEEDVDRVMDVNFKGTWLCLKYEILAMLQNGGGTNCE